VTLRGYEGDTLKLADTDIPSVGSKPKDDTCSAGAWDPIPDTSTEITAPTTFTYTYEVLPLYHVQVENGKGSGDYVEGATVSIKANDPFDRTQVDDNEVENGTGGVDDEKGETDNNEAPESSDKMRFEKWISDDDVIFDNELDVETTFIMPAANVTVTATYVKMSRSGTCGDNLTWELDDEGTLTISGSGSMKNYSTSRDGTGAFHSSAPWGLLTGEIKAIVLNDGVGSIGNNAFMSCSHVTEITIPGSVTSIGSSAFSECTGLEIVTVEDGLKSVGSWAFSNCSGLCRIDLPDTVTELEDHLFDHCSSLGEITIPYGISKVNDHMFSNCAGLKSVTLPNTVTSLGDYAFSGCTGLERITLPTGLSEMGTGAFHNCQSLRSITIPPEITEISPWCFSKCRSLTSIVIPNGVTYISEGAFENCTGMRKAKIPDSVTLIDDNAFYYYDSYYDEDTSGDSSPVIMKPIPDLVINGIGGAYAEKYARDNGFDFVDVCKPSTPSTLTVSAGIGQVTVQWKGVSSAITGYQIQYSKNSSMQGYKLITVSKSTLKRTIKNLEDSKKYYFRVRAYYKYKEKNHYSSWSSKKTATTVKLAKPNGFKLTVGKGKCTVKWSKVSDATGYKIRYSTNSKMTSSKTKTKTISKKTTVKNDVMLLASGRVYYFQIRAFKIVGGKNYYSEWSNILSAKIK